MRQLDNQRSGSSTQYLGRIKTSLFHLPIRALLLWAVLGFPQAGQAILIRHDKTLADYQGIGLSAETQSIVMLRSYFGEDPLTGTVMTGSGVHIGGGYILTAAHLIYGNGDYLDGIGITTRNNESIGVGIGDGVRIHPGYNPLDYSGTKGYDLALVRLHNWELTYNDGRADPFQAATVWVGDAITGGEIVVGGFGRRGTGLEPGVAGSGVFLGAKNVLDARSDDGRLGYFDFDSPTSPVDNLGSSLPLALEGMVNPGDSGGGWFSLDGNGKLVLSHITSGIWANLDGRADGGYGDRAVGVNIASHWSWITSAAREMDAVYGSNTQFKIAGYRILPVSGLVLLEVSDSSAKVSWQAVAGVDGYVLYRDGLKIATVSGSSFRDTGLKESTKYLYKVAVVANGAEGPASGDLEVTTIAFLEANPMVFLVDTPLEAVFHPGGNFSYSGRAGIGRQGMVTWTNLASGQTGSFASGGNWTVSVPLEVGANLVVFLCSEGQAVGEAPAVLVQGDTDSDGIDDWWEDLHFGNIDACRPEHDSDGDGMANSLEWLVGTLPRDAGSRLEVDRLTLEGRTAHIRWKTSEGRVYRLLACPDISSAQWFQVGAEILGDGGFATQSHSLPPGGDRFFYKVEFVSWPEWEQRAGAGLADSANQSTSGVMPTADRGGVTGSDTGAEATRIGGGVGDPTRSWEAVKPQPIPGFPPEWTFGDGKAGTGTRGGREAALRQRNIGAKAAREVKRGSLWVGGGGAGEGRTKAVILNTVGSEWWKSGLGRRSQDIPQVTGPVSDQGQSEREAAMTQKKSLIPDPGSEEAESWWLGRLLEVLKNILERAAGWARLRD